MKKFRKYFFRTIAILFGVMALLFSIIFIYVSANKKKIISQVTEELGKRINGNVSIGNVELSFFRHFPSVSVLIHDVRIADTLFPVHRHNFFEAKDVYANLSIPALVKKQSPVKGLRIVRGGIYLFTDSSGYSNKYLLKPKASDDKTKPSEQSGLLRFVQLNNFRLVIDDRQKEKFHDLVFRDTRFDFDYLDADKMTIEADADMQVNSLAFNTSRGSFLKGKSFTGDFELRFDRKKQQLRFDSIDVKLDKQRFNLSGEFNMAPPAPDFTFVLHTRNVVYDNVRSMLPEKISRSLAIVSVNNPLDADARIAGPLKGGEPLVQINWQAKEVHLATPFLDFDEARFRGYYTNEVTPGLPRKDPNSKIVLQDFEATWHSLPVNARQIEILDLAAPTLTCDLRSNFPLVTLNELLGSGSLELTGGTASIDMTYKGPIERNDNTNSFLNGSIGFKDGTLLYTPRNVQMQQLNGNLIFKNSDVEIQNLQTLVLGNKFTMQGFAKNLLTLINTGPNNVNIDWNISTPHLDLNSFVYLLGSRKKVTAKKTGKTAIANTAARIDDVLERGTLKVKLRANEVSYRKFEATNMLADVTLLSDSYVINNVSMNHAGGQLDLKGSLKSVGKKQQTKIDMAVTSVDVQRIFRAFENFGQDGITGESLEGRLSAKVQAGLNLDEQGKVEPASLAGKVVFSLKDGALNNYEPIKKLQRSIFKKRDFENIRFAELKNQFDIYDREVKINRMEIQSTVLSMFVEGVYSQKGNTDISVQVPLNNLKRRDSTYNPENIGIDKKGGKSIYLRGRPGPDGDIKFNIDLFNKYDKQHKAK